MQQMNLIGEEQGTPLFSQPVQTQTRIPFADCRVDAPSVRAFITQYPTTGPGMQAHDQPQRSQPWPHHPPHHHELRRQSCLQYCHSTRH